MSILFRVLLLILVATGESVAHQGEQHEETPPPQVLAPGYEPLAYDAPAPGTYDLPAIGEAADGTVVLTNGTAARLHDLFSEKITLLAFIYANCDDINGCPLTDVVFHKLQSSLSQDDDLRDRVQILSLSFDPGRDTPEALSERESALRNVALPRWRYLTTQDDEALQSILNDYQQSIVRETDANGSYTGNISHILRVYLVDAERQIRNIYSTSFLHAETLETDIRTLLIADGSPATDQSSVAGLTRTWRPGDSKTGYQSEDYTTDSLSLVNRTGTELDLVSHALKPHIGLPPLAEDIASSLTKEQVALGRRLFFDRRLSLNNTISCGMCHIPEQGFASNELATAVGIEGRSVRRNAPTVLNVGYLERLFHDGREFSLENQVWAPLLAHNEMGMPSPGLILQRLSMLPGYTKQFESAFGDACITMSRIGSALASYQRTLIAANSPFDRWHYGGEAGVLNEDAERGFSLFSGKAGCSGCHLVGPQQATFTDDEMHNTGVGYARSMGIEPETVKVQLAPGVFVEVEPEVYRASAEKPIPDLGYYEITQDPADRWKYRTPTLRNLTLTSPYMHDGSMRTLEEVVAFYNQGGHPNETQDPMVRPLGLSDKEQADLVQFLGSLTSPDVHQLVLDAFAETIGDHGGY